MEPPLYTNGSAGYLMQLSVKTNDWKVNLKRLWLGTYPRKIEDSVLQIEFSNIFQSNIFFKFNL